MTATVTVVRRAEELHARFAPGARRAVVMTLGALHEGHAALIRAARRRLDADQPPAGDAVVAGGAVADVDAGSETDAVTGSETDAVTVPAPGGRDGRATGTPSPPAPASPSSPTGEAAGARGQLVVTVYVNPLQFGPAEDFDRYPRTLDADVALAEAAGADLVFAPDDAEMYPAGQPRVRISAGPMGERLEGASRPGHFDGVLTVVAKLLHLTRPDLACFGEKDAQQLAMIRRMVADLDFPVDIVGVPTVREPDGLALSSRNRYLSPAERATAAALPAALFAARDRLVAEGALKARVAAASPDGNARAAGRAAGLAALHEPRASADAHAQAADARRLASAASARAAAGAVLRDAAALDPPLRLDYLALVRPDDFTEVPDDHEGEAILAVAGRVGTTRLIDNLRLTLGGAA